MSATQTTDPSGIERAEERVAVLEQRVRDLEGALSFLSNWGCPLGGLDEAIDAALTYRAVALRIGVGDAYASQHLALIALRERWAHAGVDLSKPREQVQS